MKPWMRYALGAAIAFGTVAVLLQLSGVAPLDGFRILWSGSLGDELNRDFTLQRLTPLLLAGLAVGVALLVGLFNIGAEGQLLVGAAAGAYVGFKFNLPAPWHLIASLAAGSAAGAIWALAPALLKVWRGAHEVITTIMFNYIAIYLTHWLVADVWRAPDTGAPQTPDVKPTAELGAFPGLAETSWGLGIALLAAIALYFLLFRTVWGYEARAVGANREAAEAAGAPYAKRVIVAMLISGGLAGLGGAIEVVGHYRYFFEGFSGGVGFDSIAAALLGAGHPLLIVASSTVFAALQQGAYFLQVERGADEKMAIIVQGVLILYVATLRVKWGKRGD